MTPIPKPVGEPPRKSNAIAQLRSASVILSMIVIGIGCSVILGWLLDLAVLKSIVVDRVTMKASTALSFIFTGISLLLWHKREQNQHRLLSAALYLLPISAISFSLIPTYSTSPK